MQKINEFQPDLIHAHYGLSGITAVLQNKVPVVTTFHNGETLSFYGNILSSLFSLRTKFMVYVAQHIYDLAYLKRKKNYVILPCGVDLNECVITDKEIARKELGFLPHKKYILFGGAFENLRKNYPLLKEGIDLLKRDDIEVLEMKGLSRLQISKILSACDLFALPTKSEGSPQALKEAMACNCPIIATDVADIKHLLGDLEGHYICSFDPKDVAEKVEKALTFNSRTKGLERIIELGLTNDLVAKKLVEIYTQIMKK
jgi:glycosyltransferase involved in cell wall biosynthesis